MNGKAVQKLSVILSAGIGIVGALQTAHIEQLFPPADAGIVVMVIGAVMAVLHSISDAPK